MAKNLENIEVVGAQEHNLQNLSVNIPRNTLTVITGVSGSGKSSLAFDTLYAEGQRRYLESYGTYARQFIGNLKRPKVESIRGLSPVVAIEQKTVSKNPRSTVGTITEIYDFLRLLYARASEAYSMETNLPMVRMSKEEIVKKIIEQFQNKAHLILAPLVKRRKGHYKELFVQLRRKGFTKVRVDGKILEIKPDMKLNRYQVHDIEVLIDQIEPSPKNKSRMLESIHLAMKNGEGSVQIFDLENQKNAYFSLAFVDPKTGLSYDEPQPNTFSFNSPYGYCPTCEGLGMESTIDEKLIFKDENLSINKGAIAPLGLYRENNSFAKLRGLSKALKFSMADSISKLNEKQKEAILHGYAKDIEIRTPYGAKYRGRWHGVLPMLNKAIYDKSYDQLYRWAEEFLTVRSCKSCDGFRLKKEALQFKFGDTHIGHLAQMSIDQLRFWLEQLPNHLTDRQSKIALELLKEIYERVNFLRDVGLGYLTLNSPSRTLSGGEAQRIRLATQIGSKLEEVLYILDEPSIGLHQRDNHKLIDALKELRDMGNTVIVVEHDKDIMSNADHILDIGPKAGVHGGKLVAAGDYTQIAAQNSLTSDYLKGKKQIEIPKVRRKGNGKKIQLLGCSGNNLKNIDFLLPLGKFVCVSGVSGSGKSTLINETLSPILHNYVYQSKKRALPYKSIKGLKYVDKVISIDQSPIGRTPRSNPATYVGFFTGIRTLFSELTESKVRGFKPGRFSFNVKGGRCENCKGGGKTVIEMSFLPDVEVLCSSCQGKRFNRETLSVRYKGKTITDVLNMTVNEACDFFESIPSVFRKIDALKQVGLGYIQLGQSAVTLSGGEAQRVKLATELSKISTGNTVYILDEPTTGLHFEDISILLSVLNKIVDKGNTVLVIEHNLDVIKVADWIVDMGPEGGAKGGEIVAEGNPEEVAKKLGPTAPFLRNELQLTASK